MYFFIGEEAESSILRRGGGTTTESYRRLRLTRSNCWPRIDSSQRPTARRLRNILATGRGISRHDSRI
ncbi:hypothetical protein C8039_02030 [Halogeometricum sp. wsp3]|nr:hypothetical protein C8039_02030 [Halogeometricum sp. wsp3]